MVWKYKLELFYWSLVDIMYLISSTVKLYFKTDFLGPVKVCPLYLSDISLLHNLSCLSYTSAL
jgi:hypothetical protein